MFELHRILLIFVFVGYTAAGSCSLNYYSHDKAKVQNIVFSDLKNISCKTRIAPGIRSSVITIAYFKANNDPSTLAYAFPAVAGQWNSVTVYCTQSNGKDVARIMSLNEEHRLDNIMCRQSSLNVKQYQNYIQTNRPDVTLIDKAPAPAKSVCRLPYSKHLVQSQLVLDNRVNATCKASGEAGWETTVLKITHQDINNEIYYLHYYQPESYEEEMWIDVQCTDAKDQSGANIARVQYIPENNRITEIECFTASEDVPTFSKNHDTPKDTAVWWDPEDLRPLCSVRHTEKPGGGHVYIPFDGTRLLICQHDPKSVDSKSVVAAVKYLDENNNAEAVLHYVLSRDVAQEIRLSLQCTDKLSYNGKNINRLSPFPQVERVAEVNCYDQNETFSQLRAESPMSTFIEWTPELADPECRVPYMMNQESFGDIAIVGTDKLTCRPDLSENASSVILSVKYQNGRYVDNYIYYVISRDVGSMLWLNVQCSNKLTENGTNMVYLKLLPTNPILDLHCFEDTRKVAKLREDNPSWNIIEWTPEIAEEAGRI